MRKLLLVAAAGFATMSAATSLLACGGYGAPAGYGYGGYAPRYNYGYRAPSPTGTVSLVPGVAPSAPTTFAPTGPAPMNPAPNVVNPAPAPAPAPGPAPA